MGKGIDFDAISELELEDSPEATERFNAVLKRAMRMPTSEREDQLLRDQCKRLGW